MREPLAAVPTLDAIAAAPALAQTLPPEARSAALVRCASVLAALASVLDRTHEVIVVDDASTDATAAIAGRYPCLLLRHERNRGKGAAVRTGLLAGVRAAGTGPRGGLVGAVGVVGHVAVLLSRSRYRQCHPAAPDRMSGGLPRRVTLPAVRPAHR